jgi:hypothetical protein
LHPIFAIDVPMHHQTPEAPGFGILKQLQPRRNPRKLQLPALFTQPAPEPTLPLVTGRLGGLGNTAMLNGGSRL